MSFEQTSVAVRQAKIVGDLNLMMRLDATRRLLFPRSNLGTRNLKTNTRAEVQWILIHSIGCLGDTDQLEHDTRHPLSLFANQYQPLENHEIQTMVPVPPHRLKKC